MHDGTWRHIFTVALGVVQWSIAIVSIAGTLALFGWILKMILKKDKRDELH
jgi:hypothetical protein